MEHLRVTASIFYLRIKTLALPECREFEIYFRLRVKATLSKLYDVRSNSTQVHLSVAISH